MLYPSLTATDKAYYLAAAKSSRRAVHLRARLLNHSGADLGVELTVLSCSIMGEWNTDDGIPVAARLTFADPDGTISIKPKNTRRGMWFSHQISVQYGLWVPELDRWIYSDEFFGPVREVGGEGIVVEVGCLSKEVQHSGDDDEGYVLVRPFTARKHQRVYLAIRRLFQVRGESHFALSKASRRLRASRTWRIGTSPMAIARKLASTLDGYIVYWRADGRLALRKRTSQPVWILDEGESSMLTERTSYRVSHGEKSHDTVVFQGTKTVKDAVASHTTLSAKKAAGVTTVVVTDVKGTFGTGKKIVLGKGTQRQESRTITNITSNTLTLKRATTYAHPKGEKATVYHTVKKRLPIYERASLPKGHSLSANTISGGKRPSARIIRNPEYHKRSKMRGRARDVVRREGRIEVEVPIRVAYIPGLELLDVLGVRAGGVNENVVVQRFEKDPVAGEIDVNWKARRVPRKGKAA